MWPPPVLAGTGPPAPGACKRASGEHKATRLGRRVSAPRPHLCSISCFMSMPCFSSSSRWAKAQSTGSAGVSAQGVRSRSWRACSGWLKRNTWLLPMMMRFPGRWRQKQPWGTCGFQVPSRVGGEGRKGCRYFICLGILASPTSGRASSPLNPGSKSPFSLEWAPLLSPKSIPLTMWFRFCRRDW